MKNLIVYYSWSGNTEVVAKEIQQRTGGDLFKIEEVKERSSFGGAAISAFWGLKSNIKPIGISLDEYDNIFIGTPVWAGHCTPAVNAFISQVKLPNKKVYAFVTQADGRFPQAVIDAISKKVEQRGGKAVDGFFIRTKMKEIISPEVVRKSVSDWIDKLPA